MKGDNLADVRRDVADILQQVLNNKISAKEARNRWPDHARDPSLDVAFHLLYHYEDDEDIRQKDLKYAKWQISQFQEIIDCFKNGNPLLDLDS